MIIPTIQKEEELWKKGYVHVAGVDEAGKGPLAGPVTAGAVVIHSAEQVIVEVRDSKLMTAKQREKAFEHIVKRSSAYGVGIVDAAEIDRIGIDGAVKKAMMQSLTQAEEMLGETLSYVIVDGSKTKTLDRFVSEKIKKGGLYHYSIAAGSILAKVTRDRIIHNLAKVYPEYGFETHVGYGTPKHVQALQTFGPCPIHRKSFEPVKSMLCKDITQIE